jgi:copper(I)-binding protein
MLNISKRFAGFALLAVVLCLGWVHPARADIVLSEGWSRATVPGTTVGVGYFVVKNTGDQARKLLLITSPVSDNVMLHQSSVDAQGVARMWPVGSLEIKAGESVRFEPNGRHVMFMDLKTPFATGKAVPLLLQFDGGEKAVTILLEVRPLVPTGVATGHSGHAH